MKRQKLHIPIFQGLNTDVDPDDLVYDSPLIRNLDFLGKGSRIKSRSGWTRKATLSPTGTGAVLWVCNVDSLPGNLLVVQDGPTLRECAINLHVEQDGYKYWKTILSGTADAGTTLNKVYDSAITTALVEVGDTIEITGGTAAGTIRAISAVEAGIVTLEYDIWPMPDTTSTFVIKRQPEADEFYTALARDKNFGLYNYKDRSFIVSPHNALHVYRRGAVRWGGITAPIQSPDISPVSSPDGLTGEYQYAYSFYNEDINIESPLSPAVTIELDEEFIRLNAIYDKHLDSTMEPYTHIKLYRKKDSWSHFYLVAKISKDSISSSESPDEFEIATNDWDKTIVVSDELTADYSDYLLDTIIKGGPITGETEQYEIESNTDYIITSKTDVFAQSVDYGDALGKFVKMEALDIGNSVEIISTGDMVTDLEGSLVEYLASNQIEVESADAVLKTHVSGGDVIVRLAGSGLFYFHVYLPEPYSKLQWRYGEAVSGSYQDTGKQHLVWSYVPHAAVWERLSYVNTTVESEDKESMYFGIVDNSANPVVDANGIITFKDYYPQDANFLNYASALHHNNLMSLARKQYLKLKHDNSGDPYFKFKIENYELNNVYSISDSVKDTNGYTIIKHALDYTLIDATVFVHDENSSDDSEYPDIWHKKATISKVPGGWVKIDKDLPVFAEGTTYQLQIYRDGEWVAGGYIDTSSSANRIIRFGSSYTYVADDTYKIVHRNIAGTVIETTVAGTRKNTIILTETPATTYDESYYAVINEKSYPIQSVNGNIITFSKEFGIVDDAPEEPEAGTQVLIYKGGNETDSRPDEMALAGEIAMSDKVQVGGFNLCTQYNGRMVFASPATYTSEDDEALATIAAGSDSVTITNVVPGRWWIGKQIVFGAESTSYYVRAVSGQVVTLYSPYTGSATSAKFRVFDEPGRVYFSYATHKDCEYIHSLYYCDVGAGDGDEITGLAAFQGKLLVSKKRSLWVVAGGSFGDPMDATEIPQVDFQSMRLPVQIGNVSPKTLRVDHFGFVWGFAGTAGIWRYDGYELKLFSDAKVLEFLSTLDSTKFSEASGSFHPGENRYYIGFLTESGSDDHDIILWVDMATDTWGVYDKVIAPCMEIMSSQ